jgi:PEP-CTERM motif-containing protein
MFSKVAIGGALTLAALVAGVSASSADTYSVTIYQGSGHGDINNANNQAQQGNPLITPADELGTGTYTGTLNLDEGSGGTNTIAAFFASDGGTLTGFSSLALNSVLSTTNFGTTTVMVITGNTNGFTLGGTIDHDDGASLYDGPAFANLVAGSPSPTTDIPTGFSGLSGPFELIYVEANGLPAVLDFAVTSSVSNTPLPATLPLLAGGLGVVGFLSRRKKQKAAALAVA